jgi:uncharacterized protein
MTPATPNMLTSAQRLSRLEDPGSDFPFYNGFPTAISGLQWLFVVAMVVVAYMVLVLPFPWPAGGLGALIPALLFPVIPLVALAYVAPGHWRAIFGRVGGRELKLMVGFALLNIVVSMSVGFIVQAFATVTSNAAASQLGSMDTSDRILFFAKTIPQLFGEEVVTMLPFLALLYALSAYTERRSAIIGAWVISSVAFGLIHLPAYDWNWIQCIVVIGSARMVLTLPWILTKNIWVSTGAHIINDWLLFSAAILGAGIATKV